MRVLFDHGAAVDQPSLFGGTALHAAVWRCQSDAVALLLSYGADADARDDRGFTPLALIAADDDRPAAARVRAQLIAASAKTASNR